MADNKIIIDLELRKAQFEGKMREAEETARAQLEKLQKAQRNYAKRPTALQAQNVAKANEAYRRTLGEVESSRAQVAKVEAKIDTEEAKRGGRLFGVEVSKQTQRFVQGFVGGYALQNLANLGFQFAMTSNPVSNNRGIKDAQQTLGGMVQGGMSGAMVGGPAGAVVGAAFGGAMSYLEAQMDHLLNDARAKWDFRNSEIDRKTRFGQSLGEQTMGYKMSHMNSGERIQELIRLADESINHNLYGVNALKAQMEEALKSGGDSPTYQRLKGQYEEQFGRSSGLISKLYDEMLSGRTLVNPIFGGTYNTSMAKQGMMTYGDAGENAFVKANEPVIQNLVDIKNLLKEFRASGAGGYTDLGEALGTLKKSAGATFGSY